MIIVIGRPGGVHVGKDDADVDAGGPRHHVGVRQ